MENMHLNNLAMINQVRDIIKDMFVKPAIYFAVCALLRVRDVKEGGAMLKGLLLRRRAHD